jgi:signal transduction histidine kinase/DNA-binding response OmpR family regulator
MVRVKLLKLRILAQFAIIIAPVTLILIFQAISDVRRTATIESIVERHGLARAAKDNFESFVTLAADAVETGSLGRRAYEALQASSSVLRNLSQRDKSAAPVATGLDSLAAQISTGMPLSRLLALQGGVQQTRDAIRAMAERYDHASSETITLSIESARQQSVIVAWATVLTLLVAAWFIYGTIIGVTEPLNAAVDLAGKIAAGEFGDEAQPPRKRDLGNLLGSLDLMREKLRQSQSEIEAYQRDLEARVEARTVEVEARTRALARSVSELQALGEVVRAVNSSLDLETVLATIVARAVELAEADAGTIYQYDEAEGFFDPRANFGVSEAMVQTLRESRIRIGDGPVGTCASRRTPFQVPDIATFNYGRQNVWLRDGIRAVVAVPLLRDERVTGALVVRRKVAGEFAASTVTLLQTLASQSVLAIENARLFRESQVKTEQLAVSSRLKSQFLANMSHELRTPLNAIIGITEMLQEDARDFNRDDEFEPLDRVLRASRQLLALINDILDLSKIEAGKMDVHLETFSIAPVIDEVMTTVRSAAEKNGNQLLVHCPKDIGTMHADQTRIRQALLNLVSNANKFTEHGEVTIEVSRETAYGCDWINMAITDTGIGLSPDQIGRLFQEFVQADASTTRKYGGTGLGLAISRRFCQMMGGDITVRSELGRGSTFTIRLPVQVGAPQPAPAKRAARRATHAAAQVAGSLILIIDDDQTVREVMARFLEREGFTTRQAGGGQEGLRLARELRPAAITLDVHMPGLDGWTVLAALKGDPELADIPVVLVTIEDNKTRGYSLGATEYMIKPFDRDRLAAILRSICSTEGRAVLLVDDDEIMRQSVRRALEQEGWEVSEAENGQLALAHLEGHRPDVIMLDLMMPVMNGFEFLSEMRRRADWQDIPVLVVTAKDLTAAERQTLYGDVERVMQKGTSTLDELLGELGRVLPRSIALGQSASVRGVLA